jgi:hypothetical protein
VPTFRFANLTGQSVVVVMAQPCPFRDALVAMITTQWIATTPGAASTTNVYDGVSGPNGGRGVLPDIAFLERLLDRRDATATDTTATDVADGDETTAPARNLPLLCVVLQGWFGCWFEGQTDDELVLQREQLLRRVLLNVRALNLRVVIVENTAMMRIDEDCRPAVGVVFAEWEPGRAVADSLHCQFCRHIEEPTAHLEDLTAFEAGFRRWTHSPADAAATRAYGADAFLVLEVARASADETWLGCRRLLYSTVWGVVSYSGRA